MRYERVLLIAMAIVLSVSVLSAIASERMVLAEGFTNTG